MSIRRKQFTLTPVGVDGSAVATLQWTLGRPGFVRALKIDYQNQPVTTDIVVTADSASGPTVFTRASSNTDLALTSVAAPGVDEGGAATSGTDVAGFPFLIGLYFDLAQGDGQTAGDEKVVIEVLYEA